MTSPSTRLISTGRTPTQARSAAPTSTARTSTRASSPAPPSPDDRGRRRPHLLGERDVGRPDGTIGRANLDGTGVDRASSPPVRLAPAYSQGGVAVDANHIYWTNRTASTIGRANLDGTNVDQSFITGAATRRDVAVDAGHVYWANWEWGDDPPEDLSPRRPRSPSTREHGIAKAAKATVKFEFKSSEPTRPSSASSTRRTGSRAGRRRSSSASSGGKHKFKVRAIDAAGNVDPSPAKDKFKVVGPSQG